jgi:non-heme chloroperoxidase
MSVAMASDDVELGFRTVGDGPTDVLFMHGWAGSGGYFDGVVDGLDLSALRVTTFDLRGHGASGRTDAGFDLDQLAEDVIAVADAAGAERFVLVGFSMGAKFAQYVTSTYGNRVLGQLLIAGCPVGEVPLPAEMLADWYGRAGDAARMVEIVQTYATRPVPTDVLERFGAAAATVPLAALKGSLEAVTSTSFVIKGGSATIPTLVVGGRNDAIFPPQVLRDAVVAPIGGARLQLLDCGHEIPVELPRELAALIEAFAADLAIPANGRRQQPVEAR